MSYDTYLRFTFSKEKVRDLFIHLAETKIESAPVELISFQNLIPTPTKLKGAKRFHWELENQGSSTIWASDDLDPEDVRTIYQNKKSTFSVAYLYESKYGAYEDPVISNILKNYNIKSLEIDYEDSQTHFHPIKKSKSLCIINEDCHHVEGKDYEICDVRMARQKVIFNLGQVPHPVFEVKKFFKYFASRAEFKNDPELFEATFGDMIADDFYFWSHQENGYFEWVKSNFCKQLISASEEMNFQILQMMGKLGTWNLSRPRKKMNYRILFAEYYSAPEIQTDFENC